MHITQNCAPEPLVTFPRSQVRLTAAVTELASLGGHRYLAEQETDKAKQAEEQAKACQVFQDMEAEEREVHERQAQEVAERARNRWRKQKRFAFTMLKRIKDDVEEEPLTSSDDEEYVEESRRDAKHRKRKQLVKSMKMLGELIDETMKGEMEVDPKTKDRIPRKSLATKTYERYVAAYNASPKWFRELYTLDHLDKLHELSLRRAEKKNIPTMKELIKLEEKSVRTPTVREILKDKPLDMFPDMRKTLPFEELDEEIAEGDATEIEGEEGEGKEEEKDPTVEPGEIEEREETDTMKVRKRGQGHLCMSMLQHWGMTIYRGERHLRGGLQFEISSTGREVPH